MTTHLRQTVKRDVQLRACFADPILEVMNFLNEVVTEFPGAISLAPGRPDEALFHVREHVDLLDVAVADRAARSGRDSREVWQELGQYGRTNGAIADLVCAHLKLDEGIEVDPESVMITVGAQEAMAVILIGLFEPGTDILLTSDPAYIGITGLARLLGIAVEPIPSGAGGLEPHAVEHTIMRLSKRGRLRALYDIPNFNNPLGTCMSRADRVELLRICGNHDVLIIEDNPYGMFAYDGERQPTLKALDENGDVIYIGSFAKTVFPGLRIGYLVADQHTPRGKRLASALSAAKSLLTVNTPPLLQAIAAGTLLDSRGSLEPIVAPKRQHYRLRRDAMVAALARNFHDAGDVSWNTPAGGFFLSLTLPFEFGPAELHRCAQDYGVIVAPMQFFCLGGTRKKQVRLCFSYVDPAGIDRGIERLARYVRDSRASAGPALLS